ncbi:MAG: DUF192 domain-containing protein [Candidatus Omnitrophota bacterium]|jgi:uncharacterized membrane protein (UPF0127 family)|nr:MAG: DUF192 domain-containing protein [Candidatus Omnitrophota bacterium]
MIVFTLSYFCGCQQSVSDGKEGMPEWALGQLPTIRMEIGGVAVEIEVAIFPREQQQGLMYRESMPENHGMLFVYDEPRYLSFWMKNTKIPLSIAFIRQDGVISNIEKMKPHTGPMNPTESYVSKYECVYALEMNEGWFERHGIKAGDVIHFPKEEIERIRNR